MLVICTLQCGVLFFELNNDARKSIDGVELDTTMLKYRIKSYMKKCLISPNKQYCACVTGIHNSVFVYDLYADDQSHTSISTYPECCDQLQWSHDSSIIVAYKREEPGAVYAVHPCVRTSQKIALRNCNYETILVDLTN